MQKAELAEDRIATDQVTSSLAGAPRCALDLGREPAGHLAHQVTDRMERLRGDQTRQITAHRANRLADRHVIVVQDDNQARIRRAGIVHALERHACAHRAVTDHSNDVALDTLQVAADCHAEAGGDRGRGMARTERVEFGLAAFGEAGQTVLLPQGLDTIAAAGQNLVGVGLMADIPDQPVMRRLENVVKRHRQLDDAKAGAKMAARLRHRTNGRRAKLACQILEVALGQPAQIIDAGNPVEQGCCGHRCHDPGGRADPVKHLVTD